MAEQTRVEEILEQVRTTDAGQVQFSKDDQSMTLEEHQAFSAQVQRIGIERRLIVECAYLPGFGQTLVRWSPAPNYFPELAENAGPVPVPTDG